MVLYAYRGEALSKLYQSLLFPHCRATRARPVICSSDRIEAPDEAGAFELPHRIPPTHKQDQPSDEICPRRRRRIIQDPLQPSTMNTLTAPSVALQNPMVQAFPFTYREPFFVFS